VVDVLIVRHQMEESLFHVLLGIGLIGWVRPLIDRPSASQLDELRGKMVEDPAKMPKLIAAITLLLLSVIGLIGMFFVPAVFRWIYLVAVAGMIVGNWFFPVASNKPKRDIAFGEFFRLVDGAILALAFSGLVASSTEPTIGEQDAPSNGGQRSSLNSGFLPRRG
jgi:hypothetical protein